MTTTTPEAEQTVAALTADAIAAGSVTRDEAGHLSTRRHLRALTPREREVAASAFIGRQVMLASSHPSMIDTGLLVGDVVAVGQIRTSTHAGAALVLVAPGHPHRASIVTLATVARIVEVPR